MSTPHPRQHLTKEQISEFESGIGYDQVPKFIMRFSDAIGATEGRLLRYLAHRTLGFGQYATVVSTRDLATIANTNNFQPALDWLRLHGVIGREAVQHRGRSTFAYWIHTDFTTWIIPADVWGRLLALRKQGCWSDPRFGSEGLQELDRPRMIRVNGKAGYDLADLKARIEALRSDPDDAADRPNGGAVAVPKAPPPAPSSGAVPAPYRGAVTPHMQGTSAPSGGAVHVPRAHEPQGLVATGEPLETTGRSPQRDGDRRQAAPPAGGPERIETRSATAPPSPDAPATPGPTWDGERTDARPPAAGGKTNGNPPPAGNGGRRDERPADVPPGERARLTNDLHHVRVLARQWYRLGTMCVRQFDLGRLTFDGPRDPGFSTLMTNLPRILIDRYEAEVLQLPEDLRTTDDECWDLLYYARNGEGAPQTSGSASPDRFHPSMHVPRYGTPEDERVWWKMSWERGPVFSIGFMNLMESAELRETESSDGGAGPSGPLDLSRILAPPREDPMAPRASLTDDLRHMRVIARQLHRMWRPMCTHLHGREPGEGWSPSQEQMATMRGLRWRLGESLVTRYEAEVLGLPPEFRTTEEEMRSCITQAHTGGGTGRDRPVPWRFDLRLHRPRYAEPADRGVWERCLDLLPPDLPDWLVAILRSEAIVALERPSTPASTTGGGGGRPRDDQETEPYGTEEDGPEPW